MDNNEKRRRKRIYVSGPMCGVEDYKGRFWAFADAIDRCGSYAVVDPAGFAAADSYGADLLDRDDWLAIDLKVLEKCDAMFMMPGWRRSEGARLLSSQFTDLILSRRKTK